jgi:hypothetical protein
MEYFEAGHVSDCMTLVSIFCLVAVVWYLHIISCVCTPILLVYSLQYAVECGIFHLTVMITVFHGAVPWFIVLLCHVMEMRRLVTLAHNCKHKITDFLASKPVIIIHKSYFEKCRVQNFVFCDARM